MFSPRTPVRASKLGPAAKPSKQPPVEGQTPLNSFQYPLGVWLHSSDPSQGDQHRQ